MIIKRLLEAGIIVFLLIFLGAAALFFNHRYLHQQNRDWARQAGQELMSAEDADQKRQDQAHRELERKFTELRGKNNDLAAWISIPDTGINQPVMYTPQNQNYYFRRSFEKTYTPGGTPFLDRRSAVTPRADNLIVYGHNMEDGSAFSDLVHYRNPEYYRSHPVIYLYTEAGREDYAVFSVIETEVYRRDLFDPYRFTREEAPGQRDAFIQALAEESIYPINISHYPEAVGGGILTLSTCGPGGGHKRILIAGRRIIAENSGEPERK